MARGRSKSPMPIVLAAVVAVVLALAVVAVWNPISTGVRNRSMNNGGTISNVADIADKSGMEVEDFIAQYGLTAEDGITGKSEIQEMANKLTLENYSKFYWGIELTDEEFDAFKAKAELGDDVAKDSKDSEVKSKFDTYASEKQAEEQAAQASAEPADDGAEEVPAAE